MELNNDVYDIVGFLVFLALLPIVYYKFKAVFKKK